MVSDSLRRDLLFHAGAHSISLKEPERRTLMMMTDAPPMVDVDVDLRDADAMTMIVQTLQTMVQGQNRIVRVVGPSPRASAGTLQVVIDEAPLQAEMKAFSVRILTLSIIISLFTAGLVYLSLHWLMVRPMLRLRNAVMRFRESPEDAAASIPSTRRRDEIGLVQRELANMQRELRTALRLKTRLAALGAAMAKVNHDLRNTLAGAMLASDRLSAIEDPEVKRVTPQLYAAIDRAAALCRRTLDFVSTDRPLLHDSGFSLRALLDEVAASVDGFGNGHHRPRIVVEDCGVGVTADRDQLFRVFNNLVLNAVHAGAEEIRIDAGIARERIEIFVRDDGPGIPARVRERLFQPFAGSGSDGGSGLGLVIAREIVTAHGGDLTLERTGPGGTVFQVALPQRRLLTKDPC
jgi:signal transduction histidine kinase